MSSLKAVTALDGVGSIKFILKSPPINVNSFFGILFMSMSKATLKSFIEVDGGL